MHRAVDQAELARARRRRSAEARSPRVSRDSGPGPSPTPAEMDPWASEARLVAQLASLAAAQVWIPPFQPFTCPSR